MFISEHTDFTSHKKQKKNGTGNTEGRMQCIIQEETRFTARDRHIIWCFIFYTQHFEFYIIQYKGLVKDILQDIFILPTEHKVFTT